MLINTSIREKQQQHVIKRKLPRIGERHSEIRFFSVYDVHDCVCFHKDGMGVILRNPTDKRHENIFCSNGDEQLRP